MVNNKTSDNEEVIIIRAKDLLDIYLTAPTEDKVTDRFIARVGRVLGITTSLHEEANMTEEELNAMISNFLDGYAVEEDNGEIARSELTLLTLSAVEGVTIGLADADLSDLTKGNVMKYRGSSVNYEIVVAIAKRKHGVEFKVVGDSKDGNY